MRRNNSSRIRLLHVTEVGICSYTCEYNVKWNRVIDAFTGNRKGVFIFQIKGDTIIWK